MALGYDPLLTARMSDRVMACFALRDRTPVYLLVHDNPGYLGVYSEGDAMPLQLRGYMARFKLISAEMADTVLQARFRARTKAVSAHIEL